MVDATKPSKLRVFGESELRDCQDYFLEIQSDSFGKTPNPTPDTRARYPITAVDSGKYPDLDPRLVNFPAPKEKTG